MNPEESLSEFFDNQMKDPNTAWSVGSFGAATPPIQHASLSQYVALT